MKKTAVITGATAGIGREFAEQLAATGHDLVLVARDESRLAATAQELQEKYAIECEILKADLSKPEDLADVETRVAQDDVEVLVNNAGFGLNQRFADGDRDREHYMIEVLVVAVMRLTHAALGGMKQRNRGEVIVVSSVASFIAGGTYSAAKAWTTVFVEGLSQELRGTNIRVSALCPGFTRTEFHQRAGIRMNGLPNIMWLDARSMVAAGLRDHYRGKVISIPGWQYKLLMFMVRIAPRPFVRSVGYGSRKRVSR